MKKLFVMFCVLMFSTTVYGQHPYMGYGYGYGYGAGTTPAGSYLQGLSQVIMAQGYWNAQTAFGVSMYQDAVGKGIQNRKSAVQNYWEIKHMWTAEQKEKADKRTQSRNNWLAKKEKADPSFVYNGKEFLNYENFKKSPEFAKMKEEILREEVKKEMEALRTSRQYQETLQNFKDYRELSYSRKTLYKKLDRVMELMEDEPR